MNNDKEHLRLLAIFHYVVAGLAAVFSFFPLLYTTVGAIFIFAARHGTPKPGEELAGRSLSSHKHYTFALVIACIECLFIPFGTILGVFTIIVLSRQSVRGLFSTATSEALA